MKLDFAALRFTEDVNIADRVYWYLTDFPLNDGEEVLAPVGPRDRLQKARVERTLLAEGESAPYDPALIKRIVARHGDTKVELGGVPCEEFGGFRYDDRHYTRPQRILLAEKIPDDRELSKYGIMTAFDAPMSEDETIYREIGRGHGILLCGGEGRVICRILFLLLRGRKESEDFLYALGLGEREIEQIKKRLG